MQEIKLKVEGMMCSGCENRVKNAVSKIDGVKEVIANHETGTVEVQADDNVNIDNIKETICNLDYEII